MPSIQASALCMAGWLLRTAPANKDGRKLPLPGPRPRRAPNPSPGLTISLPPPLQAPERVSAQDTICWMLRSIWLELAFSLFLMSRRASMAARPAKAQQAAQLQQAGWVGVVGGGCGWGFLGGGCV